LKYRKRVNKKIKKNVSNQKCCLIAYADDNDDDWETKRTAINISFFVVDLFQKQNDLSWKHME